MLYDAKDASPPAEHPLDPFLLLSKVRKLHTAIRGSDFSTYALKTLNSLLSSNASIFSDSLALLTAVNARGQRHVKNNSNGTYCIHVNFNLVLPT